MNNRTFLFFFLFALGQQSYSAIQNDAEILYTLDNESKARTMENTKYYLTIIAQLKPNKADLLTVKIYEEELKLIMQTKGLIEEDVNFLQNELLDITNAQRLAEIGPSLQTIKEQFVEASKKLGKKYSYSLETGHPEARDEKRRV